jgi:RNA polymerase sigma-70 factor (ECF subfamily)
MTRENPIPDEDLLRRAALGDEEAFEVLFSRHKDFVFRVALRFGLGRDDALDIVQETFVRLHGSAGRLNRAGKLDTWLFKVTSNLCVDHYRQNRGLRSLPEKPELPNPESEAIFADCRRRAAEHLARLSNTQRDAFVLRFFEEKSVDEVAKLLGKSPGSVRVHLFRALSKLRAAIFSKGR